MYHYSVPGRSGSWFFKAQNLAVHPGDSNGVPNHGYGSQLALEQYIYIYMWYCLQYNMVPQADSIWCIYIYNVDTIYIQYNKDYTTVNDYTLS